MASIGTGLLGILGAYPPLPSAPVSSGVATKLQKVLDTFLHLHLGLATESPGGIAAAVIDPRCGTWAGAAGSRVGSEPMTTDTQFLIASATKSVTAAAVLHLVEQGRVDLDAPIARYLPSNLHVDTNGATVRQVLQMRSGLSEVDEDGGLIERALAQPHLSIDRATVLATMAAPKAPPGTVTDYVASGYILLAYVIEQGSGMSVAQALRTLLLRDPAFLRLTFEDEEQPQGPLALAHVDPAEWTRAGLQDELQQALASGYIPTRSLASVISTAGAIVSDAPTLARWGYLLYGGSVVSDDSLALMTRFDAGSVPYGMGTADLRWIGINGIGHPGGWVGYQSVLLTRPESGVTVAALINDERLSGFSSVPDLLANIAQSC
jgi:D-alanyl-D-alanine carboxypeptidase